MTERPTSRALIRLLLKAGAWLCLTGLLPGGTSAALGLSSRHEHAQEQAPAPIERRPPPAPMPNSARESAPFSSAQRGGIRRGAQGMHIAEWMSQHSNLSPEQQQQALQREPGFQNLPQPTQQRMRDRLSQLDAMDPQRRGRLLSRNEAMERLTPDQRADVRGAMGQLGNLPPDQRRTVARTFRALRELPADQRIAALNSGRFGVPMSDEQRNVLGHLLRVEPMLPPAGNPPPPNGPAPR